MTTIVALDLETTGLNPREDKIIEIGAVKFNSTRVEGEWSKLIHPRVDIPPEITKITGITNAMVSKAPFIEDVLDELNLFLGDHPILGHNVGFDLSFLRNHHLGYDSTSIDTYEIASVILPSAGRYNLSALAQRYGIPFLGDAHRALNDARITQKLFLSLYREVTELPLVILQEIVRLGQQVSWYGSWAFQQALRFRLEEEGRTDPSDRPSVYRNPLYEIPQPIEERPLDPRDPPLALDVAEAAALLEPGGRFFQHFPDYEHRTEQVEMLRAVARAISESRHYLIEAGTGIGKSLAYLVPAALWAARNDSRVVISTNTINLQEQLINKDIPHLKANLDFDLRATVLKGRANYLCPHNLEAFRKRGPTSADEMRVLGKIIVWLNSSQSGDRNEINLNGPQENRVWHRISADNEGCSSEGCMKRTGGRCPFFLARQAAQTAHLIIVNHALLLADVATGNRVLPNYDTLIVDEAHHLESATTNALSFYTSQSNIRRTLAALGDEKKGALGWLMEQGEELLNPGNFAALGALVKDLTNKAFKVESRMDELFRTLDEFLEEQRGGKPIGRYTQQERIVEATRKQPAWTQVEIAWDDGKQALGTLLEDLQRLWEAIRDLFKVPQDEDTRMEAGMNDLRDVHRDLYEVFENLDALIFEPDMNMIYWVEAHPWQKFINIQAAPLHIGKLMERHIWYEKRAVILTSATLTTTGSFDYIRSRLDALDAEELALGSPFDYQTASLLYIVSNIPEPGDYIGHQRAVERCLLDISKAVGGRTLALFTSYAQLERTAEAITGPLAQEGIIVYEQGSGPSPHSLLESFRSADQAVLLGTRAFWEGVDVPGEDLSVLVIAKLPFDVPSDPIVSARSESFQNPFQEYMLPEAILRFRQGFGRLIRTKSDLGVVVVLDRRLESKTYGPMFVNSLPNCKRMMGPLSQVAVETSRWLNI